MTLLNSLKTTTTITTTQTSNPEGELKTAFDLIGAVDEK